MGNNPSGVSNPPSGANSLSAFSPQLSRNNTLPSMFDEIAAIKEAAAKYPEVIEAKKNYDDAQRNEQNKRMNVNNLINRNNNRRPALILAHKDAYNRTEDMGDIYHRALDEAKAKEKERRRRLGGNGTGGGRRMRKTKRGKKRARARKTMKY